AKFHAAIKKTDHLAGGHPFRDDRRKFRIGITLVRSLLGAKHFFNEFVGVLLSQIAGFLSVLTSDVAFVAEDLMPRHERGAEGSAGIARRGLNKKFLEYSF